ncbi:hypothetical protein ACP4OV_009635 [Aristida adscensionis]
MKLRSSMGFQETNKLHQRRRHDSTRADEGHHHQRHGGGKKAWVLAESIALPLPQLRPVKTGRRRHAGAGAGEEEGGEGGGEAEEEAVTPRGEGCTLPLEAATCPPAPKKPRTAVSIVGRGAAAAAAGGRRRCNCVDGGGDVLEFFRVPADLEAVFAIRAAKAN